MIAKVLVSLHQIWAITMMMIIIIIISEFNLKQLFGFFIVEKCLFAVGQSKNRI